MEWVEGAVEGVVCREIKKINDERGWLGEVFRSDELDPAIMPTMGYISVTVPGQTRGPHEHEDQTDLFVFAGPGQFKVKVWDARPTSSTHGYVTTFIVGVDAPVVLIVPPGVVHGYTNISAEDAWVLNFPNRLYAGKHRSEPVDEIRHENNGATEYRMDN